MARIHALSYPPTSLLSPSFCPRAAPRQAAARAAAGKPGFDPRLADWLSCLLPLAAERGVTLVTNMGAADPAGGGAAAAARAC